VLELTVKQQAPVPGGRNVNACRKIIKKLKDDIDNIKAGRPVAASPAESEVAVKGTLRKRKVDTGGEGDTSTKKKLRVTRRGSPWSRTKRRMIMSRSRRWC